MTSIGIPSLVICCLVATFGEGVTAASRFQPSPLAWMDVSTKSADRLSLIDNEADDASQLEGLRRRLTEDSMEIDNGCDEEWLPIEDQCFFGFDEDTNGAMDFDSCSDYCDGLNATMPCIYSNDMVYSIGAMFDEPWNVNIWLPVDDSPGAEGYYTWNDPRCESSWGRWDTYNGAEEPSSVSTNVGLNPWFFSMMNVDGASNGHCLCQKPRQAVLAENSRCTRDGAQCFPTNCDGSYTNNKACWEQPWQENVHQIQYEYLLSNEELTLDEHREKAKAWNGDLASIESPQEEAMIVGHRRGNYVYRKLGGTRTHNQCRAECRALGGQMPCIADESTSTFLREVEGDSSYFWNGMNDQIQEDEWKWENLGCDSTYRNWNTEAPSTTSLVTKSGWSGNRNDFAEYLNAGFFVNGQIVPICGVSSFHSNLREDRRFRFKYCQPNEALGLVSSLKIGSVFDNNYRDYESFECPTDSFLSRIESRHKGFPNFDRDWKFECSTFDRTYLDDCGWTGFVNDFDDRFDYEPANGYVITGMQSSYRGSSRDRRFKFRFCRLNLDDSFQRHDLGEHHDCAIVQQNGEWDDVSCSEELSCICQFESSCSSGKYLFGLTKEEDGSYGWLNENSIMWNEYSESKVTSSSFSTENGDEVFVILEDNNWSGESRNTTACAVYRRPKQVLELPNANGTVSTRLAPSVPYISADLHSTRYLHEDTISGQYIVSNENSIQIEGTQVVTFELNGMNNVLSNGVQIVLNFDYTLERSDNADCAVNVCFLGLCNEIFEKNATSDSSMMISCTDEETCNGRYLQIHQFCSSHPAGNSTVSLYDIYLRFTECPGENTELYFEDEDGRSSLLSAFCGCAEGFLSRGLRTRRLASLNDVCIPVARLNIVARNTQLEADLNIFELPSEVQELYNETDHFIVDFKDSQGREVPGDHGKKLLKSNIKIDTVTGLSPGERYTIKLEPYGRDGKKLTEIETSIEEQVVLPCACNHERVFDAGIERPGNDMTGSVDSLQVYQDKGHVMFKFKDQSHCEDSYAFTRELGNWAENPKSLQRDVFTANYFFYPLDQCSSTNFVEPSRQASDDLSSSQLKVGEQYSYCVRATGRDYMQHPTRPDLPALTSSTNKCKTHRVQWEASIKGVVALERNSGGLPVKGVAIEWELLDPINLSRVLKSGVLSALTGPAGRFEIIFKEDSSYFPFSNTTEMPVRIKASKTTGNITHNFACNEGKVDCGNEGVMISLSHLDFDEPVLITDTTSVNFEGKIVIGGTDSDLSGDGCPIKSAEVCLTDKSSPYQSSEEITLACTETDSLGYYKLPAVLGSRVGVQVNYEDHEFLPLIPDQASLLDKGILIEENQEYFGYDYQDVTTSDLIVDVVGGVCGAFLGTVELKVTVDGGCEWSQLYSQVGTRGGYTVPASVLNVQVVDVYDMVDKAKVSVRPIVDYFGGEDAIQTIDLRDVPDEEAALDQNGSPSPASQTPSVSPFSGSPSPSHSAAPSSIQSSTPTSTFDSAIQEQEDNLELLRFQYNGVLEPSLQVSGDQSGHCGIADYETDLDYGCTSFHVLPSGSVEQFTLFLRFKLKEGLYCDAVDDGFGVEFINQLGPNAEEIDGWDDYQPEFAPLFDYCKGGCAANVTHDGPQTLDGIKGNARVEVVLLAGPPNINGDYLRFVDFFLEGDATHKACIVVAGDFSTQELSSVSLPTYEPLLVLRDPPGALSFASYENVRTSMRIESEAYEAYGGFNFAFSGGPAFLLETENCFGAGAEVCGTTGEAEGEILLTREGGMNFQISHGENTKSGLFTTTWSYQTSEDPSVPGHLSDVLVVPNLHIKFKDVTEINWNSTSCKVLPEEKIKFAAGGPAESPALSFVSVQSVESTIIPGLEAAKEGLNTEETYYDAFAAKFDQAILHWKAFVTDYEATRQAANDGSLSVVPSDWFDAKENPILRGNEDVLPPEDIHVKGLTPADLIERAVPLASEDQALSGSEQARANEDALGSLNIIQFSGEGGIVTYTMAFDKTNVSNIGGPLDNFNQGTSFAYGSDESARTPVGGFHITAEGSTHLESSRSHHLIESSESQTSISFSLGDTDRYGTDSFSVAVFIDPKYGTLVFNTISGESRCPHEPGTLSATTPKIQVLERPVGKVLPEEQMVFKFALTNEGKQSSPFEFGVSGESNSGLLTPTPNGDIVTIGARDSITLTVALDIGPVDYVYPPLEFFLRNLCDDSVLSLNDSIEVYNNLETKMIEFARPCPSIHWAGLLLREDHFAINLASSNVLPVAIFNGQSAVHTLTEMVESDRLQRVRMRYRKMGDAQWSIAMALSGTELSDMDFALPGNEDAYGFAHASWAYEEQGVLDGEYEIQVQTVCDPVAGAPEDFNRYSSSIISGMIDRVPPSQYGLVDPPGMLIPGEAVTIHFSESIQCAKPFRFSLEVIVNAFEDIVFTEDELDIVCEGNRISFAFNAGQIDFEKLVGSPISFKLSNVLDLAGNKMNVPIEYQTRFESTDFTKVPVSFVLELDSTCLSSSGNEVDQEVAQQEVANELGLSDPSRVVIQDVTCDVARQSMITSVLLLNPDPTWQPSASPTISALPSMQLSEMPSISLQPSSSQLPSIAPSESGAPSAAPSNSGSPSTFPSKSGAPSSSPSLSIVPSLRPSESSNPTTAPSFSGAPSSMPTKTVFPSQLPSKSIEPSRTPSNHPSLSVHPSSSSIPSEQESQSPSDSNQPSSSPSEVPSLRPSESGNPTTAPSFSGAPSSMPTKIEPSRTASNHPSLSVQPSYSAMPSVQESQSPSGSNEPSGNPSESGMPTRKASVSPSKSLAPSENPSIEPTVRLSARPSVALSSQPSGSPSFQPSSAPSAPYASTTRSWVCYVDELKVLETENEFTLFDEREEWRLQSGELCPGSGSFLPGDHGFGADCAMDGGWTLRNRNGGNCDPPEFTTTSNPNGFYQCPLDRSSGKGWCVNQENYITSAGGTSYSMDFRIEERDSNGATVDGQINFITQRSIVFPSGSNVERIQQDTTRSSGGRRGAIRVFCDPYPGETCQEAGYVQATSRRQLAQKLDNRDKLHFENEINPMKNDGLSAHRLFRVLLQKKKVSSSNVASVQNFQFHGDPFSELKEKRKLLTSQQSMYDREFMDLKSNSTSSEQVLQALALAAEMAEKRDMAARKEAIEREEMLRQKTLEREEIFKGQIMEQFRHELQWMMLIGFTLIVVLLGVVCGCLIVFLRSSLFRDGKDENYHSVAI